jgi:adenylate kinase family enzyme
MKRVMIVGGPGSGKSMLAAALGDKTGLPVYHMDKIHYRPGWVERSRAEKDRLTEEIHALDRWIFEGGHSATYPERIARADTYIWLDVPVGRRIVRVLRRSLRYYGRTRPDLPEGCPERFNLQTVEFLRFIWRTRHSTRARLEAVHREPPAHLTVHRLETLKEVQRYLESVSARVPLTAPTQGDMAVPAKPQGTDP